GISTFMFEAEAGRARSCARDQARLPAGKRRHRVGQRPPRAPAQNPPRAPGLVGLCERGGLRAFVAEVCRGANALRHARFAEERAVLRPLPPTPYSQAEEIAVRVCGSSTIGVRGRAYSVPARLIGAIVKAEVSEAEIVVRHGREEV